MPAHKHCKLFLPARWSARGVFVLTQKWGQISRNIFLAPSQVGNFPGVINQVFLEWLIRVTMHFDLGVINQVLLWGSGFCICKNLIIQHDGWYGRSTLPLWWPLLQTWACPYVFLCSSMSTGDWDLFPGPLEWARAETGGDDRGML